MLKRESIRKWLVMGVLCISAGSIYLLPFLQEVYYKPLADALSLNNTEVGSLMSIYGVFAMLSYFPGGWIADKVSPRILITFSLISTGLIGLYFATLPSYQISLIIHALWGITTTLLFWSAIVRVTRNWAPSNEQGRAFGILQMGRGVSDILMSMPILAVFGILGSSYFALSMVIVQISLLTIISGLIAWFVLEDEDGGENSSVGTFNSGLREITTVLKLPVVWLIAVVVLAAYSAYWGTYRFTSYSTDIFSLSVVAAGAISIGKMWMSPPSALLAGFISDKIGIAKSVAILFVVLIFSFVVFAFMPGIPSLLPVMIVNVAIASLAVFALRGIYFALLEEGGIPMIITGTATGFISMIGFTPDVFMPLIGGVLLDNLPSVEGYRIFFLIVAGICGLGLMAALMIYRIVINRDTRH
ncbi:MAG: MFS transporter [Pseudomonadota bacterium]|nr:MFS transporter [Pseudomonadota bacterium]